MGSEMLFMPQKQEKTIMKSNFTQTCNRFSQFLKERRHLDAFKNIASSEIEIKGAAKDVSGVGQKNTAKKLFSKNENERMSLELFPFTSLSTVAGLESSSIYKTKSSELPKSEEERNYATTAPSMTIFYGGKVLVFDELPEHKVQEIMSLASSGTMNTHAQTQTQIQTQTRNRTLIPTPHLTQQDVIPQGASSLSDLPIARRVSLHRFMEKRKHRIASSAPYPVQTSLTQNSNSHPHKLNMTRSLYDKQLLELKL